MKKPWQFKVFFVSLKKCFDLDFEWDIVDVFSIFLYFITNAFEELNLQLL